MKNNITEYFQIKYGLGAIHMPSGRIGLYLALTNYFKEGDEVIISAVQSESVLAAILSAGLKPVIVDINPITGNMSIESVENILKKRRNIKAIITCNLYGCPEDISALMEIKKRYNLKLIEDAVHAFWGSEYAGKKIGQHGYLSIFSLDKFIDGYGGVVCSKNKEVLNKITESKKQVIKYKYGIKNSIKNKLVIFKYYFPELYNYIRKNIYYKKSIEDKYKSRYYPDFNKIESKKYRLDESILMDSYMRFHKPTYRDELSNEMKWVTKKKIIKSDMLMNQYIKGSKYLIKRCPLEYKKPDEKNIKIKYVRVPFHTNEKEKIMLYLRENEIPVDFYYTPPLNEYIQNSDIYVDATNRSMAPKEWCKNVIPLNPLYAEKIIYLLNRKNFNKKYGSF